MQKTCTLHPYTTMVTKLNNTDLQEILNFVNWYLHAALNELTDPTLWCLATKLGFNSGDTRTLKITGFPCQTRKCPYVCWGWCVLYYNFNWDYWVLFFLLKPYIYTDIHTFWWHFCHNNMFYKTPCTVYNIFWWQKGTVAWLARYKPLQFLPVWYVKGQSYRE